MIDFEIDVFSLVIQLIDERLLFFHQETLLKRFLLENRSLQRSQLLCISHHAPFKMIYSVCDHSRQITRAVKKHGFCLLTKVKLDIIDIVALGDKHIESKVEDVESDWWVW